MLTAGQLSFQAGSFEAAQALLAAAQAGPLDELGRSRVDLLHAEIAYAQNRGSDAPLLLLRAARTFEAPDGRLSRETYLDAWSAALFAGRLASAGGLHDVSRAVGTAPEAADPPRPSDLLLDGFALVFTQGRSAAAPVLGRAATAFAGGDVSVEEVLRWGWLATAAAAYVWDLDTCLTAATRGVEVARYSGALEVLPVSLNVLGQAVTLAGDFTRAAQLIAEADGSENVALDQPGGRIAYRFHARDVHLVLARAAAEPIPFRLLLDGEAPGPSHGVDVDEDGNGPELTFPEPGAEAYAFTFG